MSAITRRPRLGSIGILLALGLGVAPAAADEFHQHRLNDFRIFVETVQVGADGPYPENQLVIKVLAGDSGPIAGLEMAMDGVMSESWARDLDDDGDPEIIVAVNGFGSGSYGDLVFFEYENGTFASRILPPLPSNLSSGYMGHDTFAVDDVAIRRQFPVYAEADANCCPTGGTMEISYTYSADRFYVTDVDRDH